MFLLNGRPLPLDVSFTTPDGSQYPANWLRLSTPEEKQAIGIIEVPDAPYYDQRFYWGYNQDGELIPMDHAMLVENWIKTTQETANSLLTPTDWMVIREFDNGVIMDTNIKSWRQDIRVAAGEKIAAIQATQNTDELATYITSSEYSSWPTPQQALPENPNILE